MKKMEDTYYSEQGDSENYLLGSDKIRRFVNEQVRKKQKSIGGRFRETSTRTMSSVEISAFLKDGDTSDKLIEIWKGYPILWNTKRGACKNAKKRDKALMEVTKNIGLNPSKHYKLVAARLRSIRDSYRKRIINLSTSDLPPEYNDQKQKRNSLPLKRLEFLKSQFASQNSMRNSNGASSVPRIVAASPKEMLMDDVREVFSWDDPVTQSTEGDNDEETDVENTSSERDYTVASPPSDCFSSSPKLKDRLRNRSVKLELNIDPNGVDDGDPELITGEKLDDDDSRSDSEEVTKDSENYISYEVKIEEGDEETGQDNYTISALGTNRSLSSVEIYALLKKGDMTNRLIDIWRQYPLLWDTRLDESKNMRLRNNALMEITKKIGLDPSMHYKLVSARLRAIRDSYRSYRKRLSTHGASDILPEHDDQKQKRNSLPVKKLEFLKSQFITQMPYSERRATEAASLVDDAREEFSRENRIESATRTLGESSDLISQPIDAEDFILGVPQNTLETKMIKNGYSLSHQEESEGLGDEVRKKRRKKSDYLVNQIVRAYEKMSSHTNKNEWAAPMSLIMRTKSKEAQEAAISSLMQHFCRVVMPMMQRIDSENQ